MSQTGKIRALTWIVDASDIAGSSCRASFPPSSASFPPTRNLSFLSPSLGDLFTLKCQIIPELGRMYETTKRRFSKAHDLQSGKLWFCKFLAPRPSLLYQDICAPSDGHWQRYSAASMGLLQLVCNSPVKLSRPKLLHTAAYAPLHFNDGGEWVPAALTHV